MSHDTNKDAFDFKFVKDLVRKRVNHSGVDDRIESAINETIEDILSRESFHFMKTIIAEQKMVTDSRTSTIPDNLDWITAVTYSGGEFRGLIRGVPPEHFIREFEDRDDTRGRPTLYTLFDNLIRWYPIPDTTYEYTILFSKQHPILEDDNDLILIPKKFQKTIVMGAMVILAETFREPTVAFENKYEAGISRLIARQGRDRNIRRTFFDKGKRFRRSRPKIITAGFEYD